MSLTFAGAKALTAETPTKVALCAVARNPVQYDGKLISMIAQYDSDGFEHEGLSDPACKDTGLALLVPRDAKGMADLQSALLGGLPGTLDKIITATFTGVFRWEPKKTPFGLLNVKEMKDFTVQSKQPPFTVRPRNSKSKPVPPGTPK
jgi:hypothetical protein